jgi:hypothetical protein
VRYLAAALLAVLLSAAAVYAQLPMQQLAWKPSASSPAVGVTYQQGGKTLTQGGNVLGH